MTEIVIAKSATGLATAGVVLAAIDVSTQASLIGLVSLSINSITAVALAWIALKQHELRKQVDAVKEQTDGINKALVDSTAKASHAEGKLEGKQEEKEKQADIIIAVTGVKKE